MAEADSMSFQELAELSRAESQLYGQVAAHLQEQHLQQKQDAVRAALTAESDACCWCQWAPAFTSCSLHDWQPCCDLLIIGLA